MLTIRKNIVKIFGQLKMICTFVNVNFHSRLFIDFGESMCMKLYTAINNTKAPLNGCFFNLYIMEKIFLGFCFVSFIVYVVLVYYFLYQCLKNIKIK